MKQIYTIKFVGSAQCNKVSRWEVRKPDGSLFCCCPHEKDAKRIKNTFNGCRATTDEEIKIPEFEMVNIKADHFLMGSESEEAFSDERPVHHVRINKSFRIGKYPVTQRQWLAVMGENPSRFKSSGLDAPVENVSWYDVQEFLRKLNEKTGGQYRLPTEAEWEFACRGGRAGERWFPESELGDYAWYDDNSNGRSHEVGKKKPNPYGLYDMLGNVWEWCQDGEREYSDGRVVDPVGEGNLRALRGGSWFFNARFCRSAIRNDGSPDYRYTYVGFRLAGPPDQV